MNNSYAEGMSYEIFMKRAFQTSDNSKPGIHLSNLKNLIDAENGEDSVSHLPSAAKQLIKVKVNMNKAFDKLIKANRGADVKTELQNLKTRTSESVCSDELIQVIRRALDITPVGI